MTAMVIDLEAARRARSTPARYLVRFEHRPGEVTCHVTDRETGDEVAIATDPTAARRLSRAFRAAATAAETMQLTLEESTP